MSKKLTSDEFINRAKKVHGTVYNYSKVVYRSAHEKVEIVCKVHGEFLQTPNSHTLGAGCNLCAVVERNGTNRKSHDKFIRECRKVHKNTYDYTLVEYKNNKSKVIILCKVHGQFMQTPQDHVRRKAGCPLCYFNPTVEQFVVDARLTHGNKYNYSLVSGDRIVSHTVVEIICSKGHRFKQKKAIHLQGSGCPLCKGPSSKKEKAWIASFKNPDILPQYPLEYRLSVDGYDPKTNTVYEFYGDFWHGNPKVFDSDEINSVMGKTFGAIYEKTFLREARIRGLGCSLITMWESDWDLKVK